MKYFFYILLILSFSVNYGIAQEAQSDQADCKDHPLFTRMPNTIIANCSQALGAFEIKTSADNLEKKEGLRTEIEYDNNSGSGLSFTEIVKYYENTFIKKGGKKIFYVSDANTATFYIKSGNKDLWVVLNDMAYNKTGNYELIILEIEKVKQEWSADEMIDALNKNGSFSLAINFEQNKSELKKPYQKVLYQIVILLREHPFLKINIEGHTNNIGNEIANQKLSEDRAKAIVNYLTSNGVGKRRLLFKGLGQTKPAFDNKTEEGRIKNNRIEIVKQ